MGRVASESVRCCQCRGERERETCRDLCRGGTPLVLGRDQWGRSAMESSRGEGGLPGVCLPSLFVSASGPVPLVRSPLPAASLCTSSSSAFPSLLPSRSTSPASPPSPSSHLPLPLLSISPPPPPPPPAFSTLPHPAPHHFVLAICLPFHCCPSSSEEEAVITEISQRGWRGLSWGEADRAVRLSMADWAADGNKGVRGSQGWL